MEILAGAVLLVLGLIVLYLSRLAYCGYCDCCEYFDD